METDVAVADISTTVNIATKSYCHDWQQTTTIVLNINNSNA
jgi:hypothetical protein